MKSFLSSLDSNTSNLHSIHNMTLFSIIIPHYNIPDLLIRCLKSIPVSEDIQVIVVDDNSPDADTYLDRYPELSRPYLEFIRTTKGGGAGYARNVGLDHAKGKWLLFADADDFYVDNMYEIITSYIGSKADVIYFKKESVLSEDVTKHVNRSDYINRLIDRYFETHDEKPIRGKFNVPWAKMIRMDIVEEKGLRFEETKYSNDLYFMASIGCLARIIEVSSVILYVVTRRQDSLTSSFCQKEGELTIRAEVCFRVEKMFMQFGGNLEQQIPLKWYLNRMLSQDRKLFRYYFFRLPEIYPSIPAAIQSLCSGKGMKFTIKLYLYSFWLWIRKLIS